MKKVISGLIVITVLTGCVSSKSYMKHPVYGKNDPSNQHYTEAVDQCRASVYGAGVNIDGKIYTSASDIAPYEKEYNIWLKEEFKKTLNKSLSGVGAKVGLDSAVAVSTGKISKVNRGYTDNSSFNINPPPVKLKGVDKSRKDRESCMKKRGWVRHYP